MEIVGAIISVVQCVAPPVARRWEYHRSFAKNRDDLKEVKDKLTSKMKDITDELDQKLVHGETEAGSQVSSWLERVNKIFQEIEDTEKQLKHVKFLSRASLAKDLGEKKTKVDELYGEGVFSENHLIKKLPQRGNMMAAQTAVEGETMSQLRVREEIWRCLFDDNFAKIGVYGMGGAGKTTVAKHINDLLLGEKDKFEKVIWVNVSSNSNIRTFQDKLATKLEIDISTIDDDEARAHALRKGFLKSKRYVIILDDLWQVEHDTFEKIGIPDPMPVNGCKLILTTRFLDVCRIVNCDIEIVMDLLSEVEASEMFLKNVGSEVSSDPKLRELVKQVSRECARLPLAIVIVEGALRKKTDLNEWEVALAELKDSSASMSSGVMSNLRKSYDWLNDKKLKILFYIAHYTRKITPLKKNCW